MTIVTLTGDNGLLQKAQNAGEQSKKAEAEEQIKLIYAEYQISKYAEGNTSAGNYLKEQLEKTYGEGNVDVISSEESIVLKIIENGESKFYEYNTSTGISKELQKGINYNGKTASEIQPGDDITIVTEKFKVFAVENNTIKAMPYYNITLTDTPVQSKNAGTIQFSSTPYWSEIEGWNNNPINKAVDIDMTAKNENDYKNYIQQYINAYKETLNNMCKDKLEVRACKAQEIRPSSNNIRNPSKNGIFWTGSASSTSEYYVWSIDSDGLINNHYSIYNKLGIRPIIEIPIE